MKYILLMALALFAAPVSAQTVTGRQALPTAVYETARGSWTVMEVSVSSYSTNGTATQVDLTTLLNRSEVSVQNVSSSNVRCSQRNNVTTTTGIKIAPDGYWTIKIPAYDSSGAALKVYCVNGSGTGAVTVEVIQVAPVF